MTGGCALWLWLLTQLKPAEPLATLLTAVLFISATATEFHSVVIRRGLALSVSTIAHVAAILLLPLPTAVTLAAGGVAIEQLARRKAWFKTIFNTASTVLTVAATGWIGQQLGNPLEIADSHPLRSVVNLFAIALTYQVLTTGVIGILLSQLSGRPLHRYIFNTRSAIPEMAVGILGGLVAFVWYQSPVWIVVTVFPAAIAHLTFRYIHRVVTETDSAVETMAQIVDERDHYTYVHSSHVAEYSELLARALKLDPDEVDVIASAARVHDLGKIGIGNRALYKDDVLDEGEQAEMQSHPVIGARILGHFEGYRQGMTYVLHHHERWDGKGYPSQLKGEEIPLGARIIAVADAFDAMTTDRPYRRALPLDIAFDRLRAGIGTYFDPVIAGHFLTLEPEIRECMAARAPMLRVVQSPQENAEPRLSDSVVSEPFELDGPRGRVSAG
jgi:hypothetical protein